MNVPYSRIPAFHQLIHIENRVGDCEVRRADALRDLHVAEKRFMKADEELRAAKLEWAAATEHCEEALDR